MLNKSTFLSDETINCMNCINLELSKEVQCAVLAKIHKWDRDILEIDTPLTFQCLGHTMKG